MTAFVVDTNVPIVANGHSPQADDQCRLTCIRRLEHLMEEGTVGIDNRDEILEEYIRTVKPTAGQKVGDRFVIHVYQPSVWGEPGTKNRGDADRR